MKGNVIIGQGFKSTTIVQPARTLGLLRCALDDCGAVRNTGRPCEGGPRPWLHGVVTGELGKHRLLHSTLRNSLSGSAWMLVIAESEGVPEFSQDTRSQALYRLI